MIHIISLYKHTPFNNIYISKTRYGEVARSIIISSQVKRKLHKLVQIIYEFIRQRAVFKYTLDGRAIDKLRDQVLMAMLLMLQLKYYV